MLYQLDVIYYQIQINKLIFFLINLNFKINKYFIDVIIINI